MPSIVYSDSLTPEYLATLGQSLKDHLYNALDCCVTHGVHGALLPQLTPFTAAIYRLSRDLQGPVLEMQLRGVRVDKAERQKLITEIERDISLVDHNLATLLKGCLGIEGLNWNSHQQLKHLFYEVLHLPVQRKRGKNGWGPTVERDALEKLLLCDFYCQPIINHVLVLKDLAKRLGTVKTALDQRGRMTTTFGIAGTETGRFSSYESPFEEGGNTQNWEKKIRRILCADVGMKFAYVDLKTAESIALGARCWNLFYPEMGAAAGKYLDACLSSDVHTAVAREAWPKVAWTGDAQKDRKYAEETKVYRDHDYRHIAKQLGHATNLYGQPPQLSKRMHIPVDVVAAFQQGYFAGYPELRKYHTWCAARLMVHGNDTSLMGRPRWFFGRRDEDTTLREFIAYSQQETVAHILSLGLLSLWRAHIAQPLLQVHDALLIQYPQHLEDQLIPLFRQHLEIPVALLHGRSFTIPTDVEVGWNWGPHDPATNPDGMHKYKGHDDRKRTETSVLGRRL